MGGTRAVNPGIKSVGERWRHHNQNRTHDNQNRTHDNQNPTIVGERYWILARESTGVDTHVGVSNSGPPLAVAALDSTNPGLATTLVQRQIRTVNGSSSPVKSRQQRQLLFNQL